MKLLICAFICLVTTKAFSQDSFLSVRKVIDKTIQKIQSSSISDYYYSCIESEDIKFQVYNNFSSSGEYGDFSLENFSYLSVAEYAQEFHKSLPFSCGFESIDNIERKFMRELLQAEDVDKLGDLNWD